MIKTYPLGGDYFFAEFNLGDTNIEGISMQFYRARGFKPASETQERPRRITFESESGEAISAYFNFREIWAQRLEDNGYNLRNFKLISSYDFNQEGRLLMKSGIEIRKDGEDLMAILRVEKLASKEKIKTINSWLKRLQ